jgi:hypothetical protein
MISYKNKVPFPGSKKRTALPEHEWLKVPNAHEAIISAEQFTEAQAHFRSFKQRAKSTSPKHSPFTGKIICGHCKKVMVQSYTQNAHHFCQSAKLNTGQGCYGGRVSVSDLEDAFLAAAKLEAQEGFDLKVQQKQRTQEENRSSAKRSNILAELKRLSINFALLEQRSIALYEEFAEGKIGRDAYVSAKASNSADMTSAQNRIDEMNRNLAAIEEAAALRPIIADESVLCRILTTNVVTDEVMALLDRIVVYDAEHIEIRFVFGDLVST